MLLEAGLTLASELSLPIVTALVPLIGYDLTAEVSKQAMKEGKTVRSVIMFDA